MRCTAESETGGAAILINKTKKVQPRDIVRCVKLHPDTLARIPETSIAGPEKKFSIMGKTRPMLVFQLAQRDDTFQALEFTSQTPDSNFKRDFSVDGKGAPRDYRRETKFESGSFLRIFPLLSCDNGQLRGTPIAAMPEEAFRDIVKQVANRLLKP
jgi:hypothetical protein